jgi:hypothetical protein
MKTVPPTTAEGIERYLGSGLVKGIGPILAKKLVLAERTEALVILAHELRHMHQQHGYAVHSSFPVGRVKNSRGRFSEVKRECSSECSLNSYLICRIRGLCAERNDILQNEAERVSARQHETFGLADHLAAMLGVL